ncbi:hypothetical protein SALBM217S_00756 [Streptomyces griseoloalbus]
MSATAPYAGPSPIRRRPLAAAALLAALAGLVFGLLLASAAGVRARRPHRERPEVDGAVVDTAPKEVTLSFSEAIAVGDDSIRVLDPSGRRARCRGRGGRLEGRGDRADRPTTAR